MSAARLRLVLFLGSWVCCIVCLGCGAPPTAPSTETDPAIRQVVTGLLPRDAGEGASTFTLLERMEFWNVPGVSVVVIRDYEIAWARVYGMADVERLRPVELETRFQAGSISKPVAAAGVLRLVDQGRLEVDAPINTYLSSWKLPDNEHTRQAPVTLRRLLSHTAGTTVHGFPGYEPGAAVPTLVQVLDGATPANTAAIRVDTLPGSRYRYSGGGITIVQQAVVDVSGMDFPTLMRRAVLEPTGMSHSTYEQPLPADALQFAAVGYDREGQPIAGGRHVYPEMAAAGLWTTADDLARFVIAIQQSWRGDDEALLTRERVSTMLTPVMDSAGLGLFVRAAADSVYFEHGGANAGFEALFVAERDRGFGAVVMTNSNNGVRLADEIIRSVARVYDWPGYTPDR